MKPNIKPKNVGLSSAHKVLSVTILKPNERSCAYEEHLSILLLLHYLFFFYLHDILELLLPIFTRFIPFASIHKPKNN